MWWNRNLNKTLEYKLPDDSPAVRLGNAIEQGYLAQNREVKVVEKVSFAPSSLVYGSGKCFAAETEFVTDRGIRTLGEMAGQEVMVWTGTGAWNKSGQTEFNSGRGWKKATVESFGIQPLMKITIVRHGVEREIFATAEHRWITATSKAVRSQSRTKATVRLTKELEPGHILWNSGGTSGLPELSPDGIRAGFVYGDGSVEKNDRFGSARVSLFGEKDSALMPFFSGYPTSNPKVSKSESIHMNNNQVSYVTIGGLPRSHKALPDMNESSSFLFGWLSGYFAADGNIHDGGSASITSHNRESVVAVRNICEILRIGHGEILEYDVQKMGKVYREYNISLSYQDLPPEFFLIAAHRNYHATMIERKPQAGRRWVVKSVETTDRVEEVFCVVEPETERFALADGILTMNCPRNWHMKFAGKYIMDDQADAMGQATMQNGTGAHERLQRAMEESGIKVENEREITFDSPPIRAFVDSIIEMDDVKYVVEIKTIGSEKFFHLESSMQPLDYHMYQLLIYMYVLRIPRGFVLYENRNDLTFTIMPVYMDETNLKVVKDALEWMRTVYQTHLDGELPKRPYTKSSRECKFCPLKKACWEDAPEGTVEIQPMEVHKW